jgi:hypothetical protein
MHALFKGEVEGKMTSGSTGFSFPHLRVEQLAKSLPQLCDTAQLLPVETHNQKNYDATSNG